MIFTETKLKGAYLIDLDKHEDERGFFARAWCIDEFGKHGLSQRIVQCNISFNKKRGTLRGMHFQDAPYEETKLVHCTRGALYDVIIDLRSDSPTFKEWFSVELTAQNYRALYVPKGIAHGFQTLVNNTEVFYQMGEFFHPESARGIRWDDPAFGIKWPLTDSLIISEKDRTYDNWKG
jgi:dTDP-4-dehydrorhamnose 3,5-epimerase